MTTLTPSDNPYADILRFIEAIISLPEDKKLKLINMMEGTVRNLTGEETWVIWVARNPVFTGTGLTQIVFTRTNCHVSLDRDCLVDFTTLYERMAREVETVLLTYLYLQV
jgi:hypothetical protein